MWRSVDTTGAIAAPEEFFAVGNVTKDDREPSSAWARRHEPGFLDNHTSFFQIFHWVVDQEAPGNLGSFSLQALYLRHR